MTQELADKLIKHYQYGIDECEKLNTVEKIKSLLDDLVLDMGICKCALFVFKYTEIRDDKWVKSFKPYSSKLFWFRTPYDLYDKKEIINALQLRLDRLKTFKETSKIELI